VTSVAVQEEQARTRRGGAAPATTSPSFPNGQNRLEPYTHFDDSVLTEEGGMLTVLFSGGVAGWTIDYGDGSPPAILNAEQISHAYAAPPGPPGSAVAVTASLRDTAGTLQGALTFAVPRRCIDPRQVAAVEVLRAGDYPAAG
jgi:hypothetical protein